MTEDEARIAASHSRVLRDGTRLGRAEELREGWYFHLVTDAIGCNGVIVNKHTGKLFHLGSAFPVERDLEVYDRGYQFERYDLVILGVRDRKQTLRVLRRIGPTVVEPTFEHGVMWRVPRPMTSAELAAKLDERPCVFAGIGLYFHVEGLERAREAGWFTFEAREHISETEP